MVMNQRAVDETVGQISKLTKWANWLSAALAVVLIWLVVSSIGAFNTWRLGHETVDEKAAHDFFVNLGIIGLAVTALLFVFYTIVAIRRLKKIDELERINASVNYKRLNKFLIIFPVLIALGLLVAIVIFCGSHLPY